MTAQTAELASGGRTMTASGVEELYKQESRRLYEALVAAFGDVSLAEDALAEAFAQLLRRGIAGVDFPSAWIWKVAFTHARGVRFTANRISNVPIDQVDVGQPSREIVEVLECLDRLSDSDRELLVLHHYHGWRLVEIADLRDVDPAAIRMRVSRARRRFQELWEGP